MSANLCYEGKRRVVHLGSFAPVRQSYPLSRSLLTLTRSHNTPSLTLSLYQNHELLAEAVREFGLVGTFSTRALQTVQAVIVYTPFHSRQPLFQAFTALPRTL